jgi:hypothetical protein
VGESESSGKSCGGDNDNKNIDQESPDPILKLLRENPNVCQKDEEEIAENDSDMVMESGVENDPVTRRSNSSNTRIKICYHSRIPAQRRSNSNASNLQSLICETIRN